MKNRLTSLAAMLLVVWYSLSVIGFDVHTCLASGQVYIATVVSGTGCDDIHPDNGGKKCCSCCSHGHEREGAGLDTKPCCTDQWQMITLTGMPADDGKAFSMTPVCVKCVNQGVLLAKNDLSNIHIQASRAFHKQDFGPLLFPDIQSEYNIWRI